MAEITRMIEDVPQRQHNEDRLRRADSWHRHCETVGTRTEKFMFLWIAFNAAYGSYRMPFSHEGQQREPQKFNDFLRRIVRHDNDDVIEGILCKRHYHPIQELLRNQYAFEPFWKAISGLSGLVDDWEEHFESEKDKAFRAFRNRDIPALLALVFSRLYTLRNQLMHGGATFETGWGADQIRAGCEIMSALVPEIIRIMRSDIEKNRHRRPGEGSPIHASTTNGNERRGVEQAA